MDHSLNKVKSYLNRDKRAAMYLLESKQLELEQLLKEIERTKDIIKMLIDMIENLNKIVI